LSRGRTSFTEKGKNVGRRQKKNNEWKKRRGKGKKKGGTRNARGLAAFGRGRIFWGGGSNPPEWEKVRKKGERKHPDNGETPPSILSSQVSGKE